MRMYPNLLKPLFDLIVATTLFLLLLPIFLFVMLVLFFSNGGKPFFTQIRPGKNEKIFRIIKFKTMNERTDKEGKLLTDSERLTPIGAFIRKTSLDEIPQLLNVIKGDMSLVGPRPLLTEYLPLYNEEQKNRHKVRPGMTGWAQVNGRNSISWQQKFVYDVWYVNHLSFFLDCKIIALTIKKVFLRDGISQEGLTGMEIFNGNRINT